MAHSSVLEIISEHTDVPLILHRKNRYKFCLTDISNLPLRIKRKHWDVDQCVLTFDYKCSSFISHIGINTISEELIIVRNINVTQNWRSFSIDLSDYNRSSGYSFGGRFVSNQEYPVAFQNVRRAGKSRHKGRLQKTLIEKHHPQKKLFIRFCFS